MTLSLKGGLRLLVHRLGRAVQQDEHFLGVGVALTDEVLALGEVPQLGIGLERVDLLAP